MMPVATGVQATEFSFSGFGTLLSPGMTGAVYALFRPAEDEGRDHGAPTDRTLQQLEMVYRP